MVAFLHTENTPNPVFGSPEKNASTTLQVQYSWLKRAEPPLEEENPLAARDSHGNVGPESCCMEPFAVKGAIQGGGRSSTPEKYPRKERKWILGPKTRLKTPNLLPFASEGPSWRGETWSQLEIRAGMWVPKVVILNRLLSKMPYRVAGELAPAKSMRARSENCFWEPKTE